MAMLNNQMVTHRFWPIPKYHCRPRSFPCKCPRDFPIIFHHIFIGVPWCSHRFFIGISDVYHIFCPYFHLPGGFFPCPSQPWGDSGGLPTAGPGGRHLVPRAAAALPARPHGGGGNHWVTAGIRGPGCERWPVLGALEHGFYNGNMINSG